MADKILNQPRLFLLDSLRIKKWGRLYLSKNISPFSDIFEASQRKEETGQNLISEVHKRQEWIL